jgi:hypothetical protein
MQEFSHQRCLLEPIQQTKLLLWSFCARNAPYFLHFDLWKSIDYMDFQVQSCQALVRRNLLFPNIIELKLMWFMSAWLSTREMV